MHASRDCIKLRPSSIDLVDDEFAPAIGGGSSRRSWRPCVKCGGPLIGAVAHQMMTALSIDGPPRHPPRPVLLASHPITDATEEWQLGQRRHVRRLVETVAEDLDGLSGRTEDGGEETGSFWALVEMPTRLLSTVASLVRVIPLPRAPLDAGTASGFESAGTAAVMTFLAAADPVLAGVLWPAGPDAGTVEQLGELWVASIEACVPVHASA